jgi:CotH kinase protein
MGRRGSGGGGIRLSPLEGSRDGSKPLLYRLLMVPELRERYLGHVRDIAENWLDWERLQPIVEDYRALIRDVVETDPSKLYSMSEFELGVDGATSGGGFGGPGAPPGMSLRAIIEQRQANLLEWLAANAGAVTL